MTSRASAKSPAIRRVSFVNRERTGFGLLSVDAEKLEPGSSLNGETEGSCEATWAPTESVASRQAGRKWSVRPITGLSSRIRGGPLRCLRAASPPEDFQF